MKEKVRLGITAIILGLSLVSLPSYATPKDTVKYGKWESLGKGYLGRAKTIDKSALAANLENDGSGSTGIQNQAPVYALWLGTGEEGMYQVSVSEIAAGLGVSESQIRDYADKKKLVLKYEGKNHAWHYDEDADTISFVAEAYDSFYTDKNAFHFALSKKKKKVIKSEKKKKGPKSSSPSDLKPFYETLHFEEEAANLWFYTFAVLPEHSPDIDYWPWLRFFSVEPTGSPINSGSVELEIPDLSGNSMDFRIALRGATDLDGPFSVYPGAPGYVNENDHAMAAFLEYTNQGGSQSSVKIGYVEWDYFNVAEIQESINLPDGPSVDGLYTVRFESTGRPKGLTTFSLMDEIEVGYLRNPIADDGQLWLHAAEGGNQSVSGFSSDELVVIESPGSKAKFIDNVLIEQAGDYKVTFKAKKGKDYLVYENSDIVSALKMATVTPDESSSLTSKHNRGNYVIIAPKNGFYETATELKTLRTGKPFSDVKIAWLEDIYEVFSYGRVDPFAITRFVDYASRNWSVKPEMIVIVGNGNFDHKNRNDFNDSFVPVLMDHMDYDRKNGVGNQSLGLFASDDRMVLGDSGRPIAVGRIPVLTDSEGTGYVQRIVAYEQSAASNANGFGSRTAKLMADKADNGGNFPANMIDLAVTTPSEVGQPVRDLDELGFSSVEVLKYDEDPASAFSDDVNWDKDLVVYDGHGSQVNWGKANIFTLNDAKTLINSNLPLFTALSCSVGNFAVPGVTDISTTMMLAGEVDVGNNVLVDKGGVIASMSPVSLSFDYDAKIIGKQFFNNLYEHGSTLTIGEAVRMAKMSAVDSGNLIHRFVPNIYTIIGDPGIRPQ